LHYKKKKRRVGAANYLIESNDKYIRRYPETDLVKILKDSGYHSDEWEETDPEDEWPTIQPAVEEDDSTNTEEAIKKKTTSIYIYERWWRSSAVFIILMFYFIS
jgi:hypothetical protein